MVFSWSLVEVPRYIFYAINLYSDKPPYILFWLRYSLFAILYPTGISGELLQIWNSRKDFENSPYSNLLLFVLLVYVPSAPYMYYHMVVQRSRAFKKRKDSGDKKAY